MMNSRIRRLLAVAAVGSLTALTPLASDAKKNERQQHAVRETPRHPDRGQHSGRRADPPSQQEARRQEARRVPPPPPARPAEAAPRTAPPQPAQQQAQARPESRTSFAEAMEQLRRRHAGPQPQPRTEAARPAPVTAERRDRDDRDHDRGHDWDRDRHRGDHGFHARIVVGRAYPYYDPYYAYDPYLHGPGYPYPYAYGYTTVSPVPWSYEEPIATDVAAIELNVKPRDADVYVDGSLIGEARDYDDPDTPVWVRPGDHQLELRRPGFDPITTSIRVNGGQAYSLHFELQELGEYEDGPNS